MPSFNSIFIMADSGARGSTQQIRQLAGMRGLMAKPSGEIIETPITANFREGLSVLQYFISTHGARKGLADTALKTANSGYLTRRLVDVAQDVDRHRVRLRHARRHRRSAPLVEGGEDHRDAWATASSAAWRSTTSSIPSPTKSLVAGERGDRRRHDEEDRRSGYRPRQDPLGAHLPVARRGICVQCYGRDLARGRMVNIGEAVGVIAAQSIGEPGTQLTMRTFHIGGTASGRAEQSTLEADDQGHGASSSTSSTVKNKEGYLVGHEPQRRDRHHRRHGPRARALRRRLRRQAARQGRRAGRSRASCIAEWDPFSTPILTEVSGIVKFGDIDRRRHDAGAVRRGHRSLAQGHHRVEGHATSVRRISIMDDKGKTLKIDGLATAWRATCCPSAPTSSSTTATRSRPATSSRRSTAKPRRPRTSPAVCRASPSSSKPASPRMHAVITEIDGIGSFGKDTKGKRKVIVTPEVGEPKEYLIAKGKPPGGQRRRLRQGRRAADGRPVNPHDILRCSARRLSPSTSSTKSRKSIVSRA